MAGKAGTHSFGKHSVTINDDGSINVRPGDWLSRYSAALHNGDVTRVNEYGRMENAKLVPVRNVNHIVAGETLYHIPTYQAAKGSVSGAPQADAKTRVWLGLGVDVQYTMGVIGQKLVVFSLRSYDDPDRVAMFLIDGYKFGLSVDLTSTAYLAIATGLDAPGQLNGQNASDKLEFGLTLALGLKWGQLFKSGKKAYKGGAAVFPTVERAGQVAKKRLGPLLSRLSTVVKEQVEQGKSGGAIKRAVINLVERELKQVGPEQLINSPEALRNTAKAAAGIDFDSPLPQLNLVGLLGAGTGAGFHWEFGEVILLSSSTDAA